MEPTLLVLAAGMGSRYGGLKQMDPMGPNGETVLDYSVYDAIRAGFKRVVFIIREDFADLFKEQVGAKFAGKIEVDYVFQKLDDLPVGFAVPEGRVKPWGTIHAIRAARTAISGPFAVINADDFYGSDAYQQIAKYFAQTTEQNDDKSHYCMVGYHITKTLSDHGDVNRGICSAENGFLKDVEEVTEIKREDDGNIYGNGLDGNRREVPESAIASMNFWGFTNEFFTQIEAHFITFLKERGTELKSECYIPTLVDELIREDRGDCKVLETTSSWFGVTYPEDKPHVVENIQQLIDAGDYPTPLD
ncbi:NTP transferase domain-containing protein [Verrucomicrobiaceae bacterium N1E253]|uniref:NTP transferase domain-containing protein n=1 Tax=Oceaniferula marina TaxID=2748318 RepID=A0A851GJ66_9BACT|nr:sugar phosphate nucleotidyltransferase [Oceaniferula marina]NWK57219.1 NTP transferase domain-containing protein [Oceaniferula marina]